MNNALELLRLGASRLTDVLGVVIVGNITIGLYLAMLVGGITGAFLGQFMHDRRRAKDWLQLMRPQHQQETPLQVALSILGRKVRLFASPFLARVRCAWQTLPRFVPAQQQAVCSSSPLTHDHKECHERSCCNHRPSVQTGCESLSMNTSNVRVQRTRDFARSSGTTS